MRPRESDENDGEGDVLAILTTNTLYYAYIAYFPMFESNE